MTTSSFSFSLIIITLLSSVRAQAGLQKQCYSSNSTEARYSITSYINQTGYWNSQIVSREDKKSGSRPWSVDVVQTTVDCDGVPKLQTVTTITVPVIHVPQRVGPDYDFYPGLGYYKFHTTRKTWDEAKDVCASEGGHLAIINSIAEKNLFVQIAAMQSYTSWIHMGFRRNSAGQFVTIFGEPISATGYSVWGDGQPDNLKTNNENCGSMHPTGGYLNDYGCAIKVSFFCEQELE